MREFLRDRRGSGVLWIAFLILLFFTLAAVVYAGATVYSKYQTCETELERLATVTVDMSTVNENVRDLALDLPDSVESLLEDNLVGTGWTQEGGDWGKYDENKWVYSLEDMQVTVEGPSLRVDATFRMPLPWVVGGKVEVTIPMTVRSRILFLK